MTTTTLSHEDLLLLIDDLLELEVLELIPSADTPGDYYIPYMMNDAVEYYLTLKNCQVMGQIPKEFAGEIFVKLVKDPERPGLIFDMPGGNKLTVWFDRCEAVRCFYQYHRIWHCWRPGAEPWRMLVYMIGTIHDKYAFLGPEAVNEEEMAILPLVHFGPFRFYSPIDKPLDDRYPESEDGWACMRAMAHEAGDLDYLKMLDHAELLKKLPFYHAENAARPLTEALDKPDRRSLFELIYLKVCEASLHYPERVYDAETTARMEAERRRVKEELYAQGYSGVYPLFTKGTMWARAMEEHPFTVQALDYDGFSFDIRVMTWEK